MSERDWPLHVRRARPADRAAVLEFASTTFDGWDYVPRAWDAWIDAPDGVLLVGCNPDERDRPVAVSRVALLSPTEAWVEGIRVDPRVRGLGVASDLQVAELRWAGASGANVVRYATGQRNEASHRLGARHGFSLLCALANWHTHSTDPPWDDDHDPEDDDKSGFDDGPRHAADAMRSQLLDALHGEGLRCPPADSGRWWQRLDTDASFNAAQRLYEHRAWTVQQLSRARFEAHAAAGELLVSEPTNGWALAILERRTEPAEDVELHLGIVAGDGPAALDLLTRIRRRAGRRIRFRLATPDAPLLRDMEEVMAAARFHARPFQLHILARPLDEAHPPPEVPALLEMADEKMAIEAPA